MYRLSTVPRSIPSFSCSSVLACTLFHSILPSLLNTSLNPLVVSSIHSFHNHFRYSFSSGVSDKCSISFSFSFLAYLLTALICHSKALSLKILTPNAKAFVLDRNSDRKKSNGTKTTIFAKIPVPRTSTLTNPFPASLKHEFPTNDRDYPLYPFTILQK